MQDETTKYCTDCGGKLVKSSEVEYSCSNCELIHYESAKPVAMIILRKDDQVCLIKQSYVSEYYVLIAGYNDLGETMENTVYREVLEEVSCRVSNIEYFRSYFYEKKKLLMFCYVCDTEEEVSINNEEVDSYKWFNVKDAVSAVREGSTAHKCLLDYFMNG